MIENMGTYICTLGEGPLWHPLRGELYWVDILNRKFRNARQSWQFDEYISAMGWIDIDTLILASERGLWKISLETGAFEPLAPIEEDNPNTRSNDGRADPQGGFWISTMDKNAAGKAGAIYRYYRGEVRRLFSGLTIPNSIAFAPSGDLAYFADTRAQHILRVSLDNEGWPGEPEMFLDLRSKGLNPDGSVVDSAGNLWNAQWGAGRVACYGSDGTFKEEIKLPATQITCPAFGGQDFSTLFVTSAADGLDGPDDGKTFVIQTRHIGQAEHQVIL